MKRKEKYYILMLNYFLDRKVTKNLIVCPASLLQVWENHLLYNVSRDVYVLYKYHGVDRKTPRCPPNTDGTKKILIVMTSYNLILDDFKNDKELYGVSEGFIILCIGENFDVTFLSIDHLGSDNFGRGAYDKKCDESTI